jgi:hypothetical protein
MIPASSASGAAPPAATDEPCAPNGNQPPSTRSPRAPLPFNDLRLGWCGQRPAASRLAADDPDTRVTNQPTRSPTP